jgi:hypothetical protein
MPLNRPTLKIALTINEACTTIELADTTGEYPAAANGYAAPNTIVHDDVTSLVVVVRNKTTGTYFTYTFGILLQVTQTTTLSLDGGTATDIHTEVGALAFPFITDVNEFDLFGDYGVTLPDFDDGVYQVEYTISGESTGGGGSPNTPFSYTTSKMTVRDCDLCECIADKFVEIDPNCNCTDKSIPFIQRIQALSQSAMFAAEKGMATKAVNALNKAIELCACTNCDC